MFLDKIGKLIKTRQKSLDVREPVMYIQISKTKQSRNGGYQMENNIRNLRLKKGMTQQELGLKFEKPKDITIISRWERGIIKPNAINVIELARILGVEPGKIFSDDLDRQVSL